MMKYIKYISKTCLVAALAVAAVSCDDDDVTVGVANPDNFELPAGNVVYVTDAAGSQTTTSVNFRDNATVDLYVASSKAVDSDVNVSFAYDPAVLAAYNAANGTSYTAFPEGNVSLGGGNVTLANGERKSAAFKVTITKSSVTPGETYAIPLSVKADGATMAQGRDSRVILVRDLSEMPLAAKTYNGQPGVEVISFFEVNDVNPLTALTYTLSNTKQPLIDIVVLFAANINFNSETNRPYVSFNENVQAILDNRAKYIKPLQERGIKVVLGILGNHDRAGVSNLSDEGAQAFAKEVKNVCDTYGLDGINLDDEYTSHIYPAPAGFVDPSREAFSRLYYEIKKAQPERLNIHYLFSQFISPALVPVADLVTGEVKQPGDYIDYAVNDYGRDYALDTYVPGLSPKHFGRFSQEFSQNRFASEEQLTEIRDSEYNTNMIFSLNPFRSSNRFAQLEALERMANIFYGQSIVEGRVYGKDW